jgi:two-component system, cell cycle response regulator DivK
VFPEPQPRARVAVVEDNPDNRLLIDAMLGDRYDLTEYASGPEALAGMTQAPPDVVLLDISLPGMDGVEVLHRARELPALRGVGFVAITAHAMQGDRQRFLAEGFDDYVTKPIVDEAVLEAAIVRLLQR